MKIKVVLIVFLIFSNFHSFATHIVGGEIYYDSLGNNQYRITIELFRDCQNSTTLFDDPINYTVFYANGTQFSTFSIFSPFLEILPITYDDPCVIAPSNMCIQRAIYIDTITLPFDINGYYISYQRCCWANNIQNMVDPGDNGITLTTFVPGSSLIDVHNNSARFNEYPPLVLCANNTLDFDHSAFDQDGDSLVYSLCSPFLGGSLTNIIPDPETPAPYSPINWETGFSAGIPLGPGSNVLINSQTGLMSFTPILLGNFAIGVCVQEFREGILINENMRTFGYRVVACQVEIPIAINLVGPPNLIEDCGFSGFIISRTDTTDDLTIQVFLSGMAINGGDYAFIEDTLILPQGVFSDTIGFTPFYDGILEGTETVLFYIVIANPCDNTFDTTFMTVNIIDYIPMTIQSEDSLNVCAQMGESALLWCSVNNGVPPYTYSWAPDFGYPNNDTVTVLPSNLIPYINTITVEVLDQCFKTIQSVIQVYNQCPLIVPNVLTLNNDGVNDFLIIDHLEDYESVQLRIFNRWGNLIYENEAYQNDWSGTTKTNDHVIDGVYFYTATPTSEKYIYDDQKKTEFTLHGFFHIIR